ncbi:MAG: ATP-binding protein [Dehalococcoidia bacterium]
MHILLVEDEARLATAVRRALQEEGHVVDWLADGDEALIQAETQSYEAIVLDVMLPGLDGYAIAQRLRKAGTATPILMLTAKDAVSDRVRGLDSGADDYLVKPFALSELLARVRALGRRSREAIRGGKRIELTSKEFALLDLGDPGRLRQLLLIVLDNALKYTPAGGTVAVNARATGRRIEVSVQDTGRGISAEDQAHLFDRFYRVDAGRTRGDRGGSGLGLAIARELAEAHGGRITVESARGAGSKFIIRLPRAH